MLLFHDHAALNLSILLIQLIRTRGAPSLLSPNAFNSVCDCDKLPTKADLSRWFSIQNPPSVDN